MIPRHIAIVMDGNGRWAKKRGLSRSAGHREGGRAIERIIQGCVDKKIEVLTLFAFSTENWDRPKKEVRFLMNLFLKHLKKSEELNKHNVKLSIIGDHVAFGSKLKNEIQKSQQLTSSNSGLKLNIAMNYSGRWDILEATKKIVNCVYENNLNVHDIDANCFNRMLCLSDLPDPDLFIRTSGEIRISNFMLWQLAYTELYFTDVFWPDFDIVELDRALDAYSNRVRRFGKISD